MTTPVPCLPTGPTLAFRDAFSAALTEVDRAHPFIDALNCGAFTPAPVTGECTGVDDQGLLEHQLGRISAPAPLAQAARDLAPRMHFYPIMRGAPVDPLMERGLVAAQIGRNLDAPASTGMFLLHPGVYYPLHQHAAIEVYYCLSGTVTLQYGCRAAPFKLGAGQGSVTPPHVVHSLHATDGPCLLVFCWTGEIEKPIYWWDTDPAGLWQRTRWARSPQGLCSPMETTLVSDQLLAEAGETT